MADYQRIVDELRSALFAYSPETIDALRAAVADYSLACESANERLRQAGDLLQRGLRSEALQQAEMAPKLLDVVAALDFPEREQVYIFLQQCEITPPPKLMMDVASDLNEAYAIEEPLKALLTKHRLLALARASLRDRIRNLRTISENDPNNIVWREDLEAYESARIKEIQAEEAAATQQNNLTTLADLEQELHGERWSQEVPVALLNRTRESKAKLICRNATQRLEKLEPALNSAFAAFDLEKARRLRDQWQQALKEAKLAVESPVVRRAFPALQWIADEEQREQRAADLQQAIAKLEHGLETEQPRQELERLHHAVERFEEGIPDLLEQRYRSQMAAAELTASRKHTQRVVVVVAAALLIAATVGWLVIDQMRRREVRQVAGQFAELIEADLEGAKTFHTDLPTDVSENSEIKALAQKLEGRIKAETDRKQAFKEAINQLNAGDPLRPNVASLSQARELATTTSEKAELTRFETKMSEARRQNENQLNTKFQQALQALADRVSKAERGLLQNPQSRNVIESLHKELADLNAKSQTVSPQLRNHLSGLEKRVQGMQASLGDYNKNKQLLDEITAQLGDRSTFVDRLKKYAKAFPNSDRSTDFLKVAEEQALWQGLMVWNEFTEKEGKHPIIGMNPDGAKNYLIKLDALLKQYDNYPQSEVFKQHRAYVEAITHRLGEEDKPIVDELRDRFADWWMTDLWLVEDGSRNRFYSLTEVKVDPTKPVTVKYVKGFDKQTAGKLFREGELPSEIKSAPQAMLAGKAAVALNKLTDTNWEVTFYQIVAEIQADNTSDALLRLNLINQTLRIGCEGSHLLTQIFSQHRETIQKERAKMNLFANWLDPLDESAKEPRRKAAELLSRLPSPKTAVEAYKGLAQSLRKPIGDQYIWVGWLRRDDGVWTCAWGIPPRPSGTLYTIRTSADGKSVSMDQIGECRSGKLQMLEIGPGVGVEGRPVFLRVSNNPAS